MTNQLSIVQVVVVSGGAGGIGSAIVDRFLKDGSRVAIADRNKDRADELVNDLWKSFAEQDQVFWGLYKSLISSEHVLFDNGRKIRIKCFV